MQHAPEVASGNGRQFIKPTPIEVAQETEEFVVVQIQILARLLYGDSTKTPAIRSLTKTIAVVIDISSKSG